jgi:hypothetical protein
MKPPHCVVAKRTALYIHQPRWRKCWIVSRLHLLQHR